MLAASEFARSWVDSWNRRDLEAILSHYAEEIRFISPFARKVTGQPLVEGLTALRSYWAEGLSRRPSLHFELQDVFDGDQAVSIHVLDETGRRSVETMIFGADGKIVLSTGCYLI